MSNEFAAGYDEGISDGLEALYDWIVNGIEETDEISLVLRYIEATIGWEGDEDEREEG